MKRLLSLIAILATFITTAVAQQAYSYCQLDQTTLTFYYGQPNGTAWSLDGDWNTACKGTVTTVVFDQSFANYEVTSCANWFSGFTALTTADLANLNTSNVTDFSNMFSGCNNLETLIISKNFTVTSTATITNMFYNVSATTLSVQGDTSPSIAQDIFSYQVGSGTFYVFNNPARLETDNKFELDDVEINDEYNLIEYKGGLFDTYNDYHRIEYTGWGFQINYTPKIATSGTTVTLTCSNPSFAPAVSYFDDQGTAVKLTLTEIEGGWTFEMPDAMVTIDNARFQGILQLGQENKTLTILALEESEARNSGFPNIAEYVQCQQGNNTELTNFVTTCQQNVEKVIIDKSVLKVSGLDVSYLFNGFSKLTSIEGLDNINMQRTHSTASMFAGCENLESLTIGSNFYIGPADEGYSITDMFTGCMALAKGTLTVKGNTVPTIEQDIFSVFGEGSTLITDPEDLLTLGTDVKEQNGKYSWKGGMFTQFNDKGGNSIKLADPTQAASKNNPYLINNVDDMVTLAKAVNAGEAWTKNTYFKVAKANDVFDFENVTDFQPIGTYSQKGEYSFAGYFDGNGVTMKNLIIAGTGYVGLFGYASGTLENINIDGSCTVNGSASYVGGLCGYLISGTINNCSSNTNVKGVSVVGGLVGHAGYTKNDKVTLSNNTVGMDLSKDQTISIIATSGAAGAIAGSAGTVTFTNNFYNGMNATVKVGETEYKDYGYAVNLKDAVDAKSATGGELSRGLSWIYSLYTKDLTIVGDIEISYDLYTVSFTYKDDDGNDQTISKNEEQLIQSKTFIVPNFPRSYTHEIVTTLRLLDLTKGNSYENPYLITSVEDMVKLSQYVKLDKDWARHGRFKVAEENAVFDFANVQGFEPIGASATGSGYRMTNVFNGSFDGNGVTIKNLHVENEGYAGLFGVCNYYHIEGSSQTPGYYSGSHTIQNINIDASCSFSGKIVGSVIGLMTAAAGKDYLLDVVNCHNKGASVAGTTTAGGLIGQISMTANLTRNTVWGNVTGVNVGGFNGRGAASCKFTGNLIGMDLPEGQKMTITGTNGGAFMPDYSISNNSPAFSGNFYNGMAITLILGDKEYSGHGYAVGTGKKDLKGVQSATGGDLERGLYWRYNLHTKELSIEGDIETSYVLYNVSFTYKDEEGKDQTVEMNEEQLIASSTFSLPNHPWSWTYTTVPTIRLLDMTKGNSYENPYLITSAEDMVRLSLYVKLDKDWARHGRFKVAEENAVFDFANVQGFEPIGASATGSGYRMTNVFNGSFDGNGVTIKNLHVENEGYAGLFGVCNYYHIERSSLYYSGSHTIQNINIDASCSFSGKIAGSVIGLMTAAAGRDYLLDVVNCHNKGASVTGTTTAGGLIGQISMNANLTRNTVWGNVTGVNVGGFNGSGAASCRFTGNLIGMDLPKDQKMTITGTNGGAFMPAYSNSNGSPGFTDNLYNGMTVLLKLGDKEYAGHGYAIGATKEYDGIRSATGGYCGVTNVNSGKNVEWKYDLYTKDFTVFGTGATRDYTASMAPSIVKDKIETLTIGEGVTGIGKKAFSGWTSLNTVTFDGCTLTSAVSDAFDGCTAMAEGTVILDKTNPMTADVGTDILSIVTNGTLRCAETLDMSGEVTRDGEYYIWKGGTFSHYLQECTIEGITFTENKHWATFYTEGISLAIPHGLTAYVVDEIVGNEVNVSAIDYIPAGVGVLLYSETPASNVSTGAYIGSDMGYTSLLKGSMTEMTLEKEAGYILYKDEFVLTSGGKLPANRCYLPINGSDVGKSAARMMIRDRNLSTGIETFNAKADTSDDAWYTLDGSKLNGRPARKGLYIHNRQKVFVK